ncbi:hypothetical protein F4553_000555 [Allocatelliglobosispora scoriae]|uniref:Alpha-L-arabinofuranosidase B arabinose-binding domain-containing protein n=1 Tax=Allocatelliglobosispora scoriae TaxID=643052 RepID=A0A841BJ01_9ACTN|nr:AbfB domain-containing protein [Allocatelliglobosispora scoriae]MBB5867176.1 hypothetical protein [Allocatelliglobosispora scoriae]
MFISLESLNVPNRFVRHAGFLAELSPIVSDTDRHDATFQLVPGLSDSRLVSFASYNYGNSVLRHQDYRVRLGERQADDLFHQDSTFVMTPGLADPTAVSFRSVNFPDRYLRHRDLHIYIDPITDDAGRRDATFRVGPGFLPQFTFDASISAADTVTLVDRHRAAVASLAACTRLAGDEKLKVLRTYEKAINHRTITTPGVNASAQVGGSYLNVNFGVLFPQGGDEIAQTLLHEMAHCAGYTHPSRRDPDWSLGQSCDDPAPRPFDCPGDNGPYYGTPPLRAEFCIAGVQSDAQLRVDRKAAGERCEIDPDGLATLSA